MSLTDVDKGSADRGAPLPNHSDIVHQDVTKAHGTNSVNYVTDATGTGQTGILSGNARLIKGSTASVVVPDGTPGVIIGTTTTVPHNLGYTPMAVAFMNNITGSGYGIQLPMWVSFGANTGGVGGAPEYLGVVRYMTYAVDGTNLYILTYSSGSAVAGTYTITYYLYQQKIQ